ncbi:MAG: glycosyl hydrolase [Chloroflexota bacterium]
MRRITTLLCFLLTACAFAPAPAAQSVAPANAAQSVAPSAVPTTSEAPAAPGRARLEPPDGALFGVNLDWGTDTAAAVSERLGVTPAAWVQFVAFPLDDGGRANLDAFVEQVASVHGLALITLEPNDGLASVTDAAVADLATTLQGYAELRVPILVRFGHEMNGSWYAWGQQPAAYIEAYRRVAAAVHEIPDAATVWAPNYGAGYPFSGGRSEALPDTPDFALLDTDYDGTLTAADDPYAPYYPGDKAVDWVGMSLYHWGNVHPWGENEVPEPGAFVARLTGTYAGANGDETDLPDFYADYTIGHDKPMAITETAALWDPAGPGPSGAEITLAWFGQVFGTDVHARFPRLRMINWFEWRKDEAEVGRVIDWRLSADPQLARSLLTDVPPGWLRFADE